MFPLKKSDKNAKLEGIIMGVQEYFPDRSSRKDLSDFCHSDLLQMKKALRPALYPGSRAFRITAPNLVPGDIAWGVRSHWENAPAFLEEIEIRDNWIIFRHVRSVTGTPIDV